MTVIARSPFLDMSSFSLAEGEAPRATLPPPAWSPFLTIYESADGENLADAPLREAYASLLNDLHDEEFDDALHELAANARALHQDQLAAGHSVADADRVVTNHFAQLISASEAALDQMGREFGGMEVGEVESEFDRFADGYASGNLEPEFQEFLGKLIKKVGRGVRAVASKAIKTAATLGLGPLLGRIKPILRPMLNRVLQSAIGRLPEALRPVARSLAGRLGLGPKRVPQPTAAVAARQTSQAAAEPGVETVDAAGADAGSAEPDPDSSPGSSVQAPAGAEAGEMAREFDQMLAEAMLAADETDLELAIARSRAVSNGSVPSVYAELDEARERFAHDLEALKDGESAAPYVENFLPAVLPALKIATKLIGRPRVVSFLAGLLGKLISRLVGPRNAPALARAMADTGLSLISLEAGEASDARLATSGITATVEETLARVASLPDHVLEHQELLEGFALEAFEQAAAANLPALFSESTYRKRPDLLEGGVNATWVMLPVARPRYKRCSRKFTVTITPQMAEAIESFEDAPLAEYFQDQLGLPEGEDVQADVHLFEILAGGTVADIARHETEIQGLGASDEVTLTQLQPLTHETAGVLLGNPALGRSLRAGTGLRTLAPGQRVFHLAMRRRPIAVAGPAGRPRVRQLSRVWVVLDVPQSQVRLSVFLSEVKAQALAVRLRQQSHAGSLAVGFHKLIGRRLPNILQGRRPQRLRIVHAGLTGAVHTALLSRLPAVVPQTFVAKLQEWLTAAFAEFVKTQAQAFLDAAEHPADGVTLTFTIDNPAGLREIAQALAQKNSPAAGSIADVIAKATVPAIKVDAAPGLARD
jgi:hypothetical protein